MCSALPLYATTVARHRLGSGKQTRTVVVIPVSSVFANAVFFTLGGRDSGFRDDSLSASDVSV